MKSIKFISVLFILFLASCSGFRPFEDDEAIKIFLENEEQVVMGVENWEGTRDCSSHAYLNKTPSGLLFTIEVYDDSIKTGEAESYMNDGVELYFDFRPPRLRKRNIYEKGVLQAVILPEPGKKQMAPIQWFPETYNTAIPGTRAYTELRDSGYVLQVSIPFSGLKRHHFWPRQTFFLDVAINDADTGARESQLMWKGKSDNWNNPHNFEQVSFNGLSETDIRKPNFLFIFTDQQTISAMSAYGNPYLQTPNMDALADYGYSFTKSYCTSPVSSPSRSSLLTGKMPHETGVNYNEMPIDSGLNNMGDFFKKAGYTTTWAGKWNLPESYPQSSHNQVSGFRLLSFLEDQNISELGEKTDGPVANAVVKFLMGRNREPFLLAVSLHNPHDICSLPGNEDAYLKPVNSESAPPLPSNHFISYKEPEFVSNSRKRENYGNEILLTQDYTENDWRNYLYQYYRMTEMADREIGNIISALEKGGYDENTIIIFTSDHGDGATAHKWATKLSLYEESVKVPMIVCRFSHHDKGIRDDVRLVSGIDILPTMMDYAGIEIPNDIRGISMKALIENPDTILRKYVVTELAIDPEDSTKTGRMITDGSYKYMIYSYGKNPEQLFNLITDEGETRNLAGLNEYARIKKKLRNALKDWIAETNDTFILK